MKKASSLLGLLLVACTAQAPVYNGTIEEEYRESLEEQGMLLSPEELYDVNDLFSLIEEEFPSYIILHREGNMHHQFVLEPDGMLLWNEVLLGEGDSIEVVRSRYYRDLNGDGLIDTFTFAENEINRGTFTEFELNTPIHQYCELTGSLCSEEEVPLSYNLLEQERYTNILLWFSEEYGR